MNKVRGFFSNLTGEKVSDTSEIKEAMGDVSLDDLRDITFPITKNEIVETLRANGSSNLLIEAIEKIPQDTFNDLNSLRNRLPY